MAIKFVDAAPGDEKPEPKPVKREARVESATEEPTDAAPPEPELPFAKPAPKKKGRKR